MIKEEKFVNGSKHYIIEDQYTVNHHVLLLPTYISISDMYGKVCLYITGDSIVDAVITPTAMKLDRLHSLGMKRFCLIRNTISEIEDFVEKNTLRNKPYYFDVNPTAYMDDNFEKAYHSLLEKYKEDHSVK